MVLRFFVVFLSLGLLLIPLIGVFFVCFFAFDDVFDGSAGVVGGDAHVSWEGGVENDKAIKSDCDAGDTLYDEGDEAV